WLSHRGHGIPVCCPVRRPLFRGDLIMPFVIFLVGQLLFWVVVPLAVRVLTALGIGFVGDVGINAARSAAAPYVTRHLGQVAADMRGLLGLAKVDVAINILLSAITTRLTLSGVSALNGRKKDFVLKA